jgi:hypothetical protein
VYVSNASIMIPRVSLEERTGEDWDHDMAINVRDRTEPSKFKRI